MQVPAATGSLTYQGLEEMAKMHAYSLIQQNDAAALAVFQRFPDVLGALCTAAHAAMGIVLNSSMPMVEWELYLGPVAKIINVSFVGEWLGRDPPEFEIRALQQVLQMPQVAAALGPERKQLMRMVLEHLREMKVRAMGCRTQQPHCA